MKPFLSIVIAFCTLSVFAFSSERWLAERNDDAGVRRLRENWRKCSARAKTPAVNVAVPVESFADGTVRTRLTAKKAQMFLDDGLVWGEGVTLERFRADGSLEGRLTATSCIVDRNGRALWIEGAAQMAWGDYVVSGEGIYFSFDREFIKIFQQSEIRAKGLKMRSGRNR